ncbi:hypothetical protein [Vibrio metschnikovii]|uniref:hypothetical protein n=1 Tax=Vibrio metschnikovii TaxID=28172 RepID=UPI00297B7AE3|nr:hypothetical protein [Vibrio metschnikovii]EKO3658724.1 hypothetical protein [Vibrio metschnikovii]
MSLWVLVLLSFVHIAVWMISPFVFFIAAFKVRRFELSKPDTNICLALWGAYSISTIASVVLVSYHYLSGSQASFYLWFVMPWFLLMGLIAYFIKASKTSLTNG